MSSNSGRESVDNLWIQELHDLRFSRSELNGLIMNYLITEGYKGVAEKFRSESGCPLPRDHTLGIDNRVKVRESIENGKIQEAISLINDLYPDLLDDNKFLYFHLQQQHIIELIREKKIDAALSHAQSQITQFAYDSHSCLTELEKTLSLLAYVDPMKCPFSELLEPSHRKQVASELNEVILESENKDAVSSISLIVKLLLWTQDTLDSHFAERSPKAKYPRLSNISDGTFEDLNLPNK